MDVRIIFGLGKGFFPLKPFKFKAFNWVTESLLYFLSSFSLPWIKRTYHWWRHSLFLVRFLSLVLSSEYLCQNVWKLLFFYTIWCIATLGLTQIHYMVMLQLHNFLQWISTTRSSCRNYIILILLSFTLFGMYSVHSLCIKSKFYRTAIVWDRK